MRNDPQSQNITSLLLAWRGGDSTALATLMPLVYRQLKDIARRVLHGQKGHDTLQSTALVHEAYLRLSDLQAMSWKDRIHFFAMSARLMRYVLVDHARRQTSAKRGGGEAPLTIDEFAIAPNEEATDLLELDEALRALNQQDPERARIVELRFFGGLSREEIGEVLGISTATVTRRWRSARAWLRKFLSEESG